MCSLSQNIDKRTLLEQNTRGGGKGIENVISPFPPPPPNQPPYLTKAIFRVVKNRCRNHHK